MLRYVRVDTERKLIDALSDDGSSILCGGTDLLVKMRAGLLAPTVLVDPSGVPELRGIDRDGACLRIGAATPWSEIETSPLVAAHAPLLTHVVRVLGSIQIRHRGTPGGNLANASPAADGAIPFLLYEAAVEIAGRQGDRAVPVEAFFLGPGKTALQRGEYIRAVRVPISSFEWVPFFHKIGKRRALTISIASLGGLASLDGGTVVELRLAAGSVAPTPLRLRTVEATVVGAPLNAAEIARARASALRAVSPIDDVRATAAYRRSVVGELVARFLGELRPA